MPATKRPHRSAPSIAAVEPSAAKPAAEIAVIVPPKTDDDILRCLTYDMSKEVLAALRGPFLEMISTHLADASVFELQAICRFLDVLDNDTGSTSPAESFITQILDIHYEIGLTPEDVEREIDPKNSNGFAMNFDGQAQQRERYDAMYGNRAAPRALLEKGCYGR